MAADLSSALAADPGVLARLAEADLAEERGERWEEVAWLRLLALQRAPSVFAAGDVGVYPDGFFAATPGRCWRWMRGGPGYWWARRPWPSVNYEPCEMPPAVARRIVEGAVRLALAALFAGRASVSSARPQA